MHHAQLERTTSAKEVTDGGPAIATPDGAELSVDERHKLLHCKIKPATAHDRILKKLPSR